MTLSAPKNCINNFRAVKESAFKDPGNLIISLALKIRKDFFGVQNIINLKTK